MNVFCGTGRLTKDPDIRQTQDGAIIARFTLAIDRRKKDEADFIPCVAFGKTAEFMEKYFSKGMKAEITGRIQTGYYEKDGKKVYTTDVICETVGFAESKKAAGEKESIDDGFVTVDEAAELPFA